MSAEGQPILIVDDHADLADNLAEVFSAVGFAPVVAYSAEQALALAGSRSVELVVTDYRLPDLSGADLLRRLAAAGRAVRGVVVTAYSDDETVRASQAAGARGVLPKPVKLDALIDVVRTLSGDPTPSPSSA